MFNSALSRVMAALGAGLAFDESSPLRPVGRKFRRAAKSLRDPSDPVQAKRIAAAEAKRERKARKLTMHTHRAMILNRAHETFPVSECVSQGVVPVRLHPFYVNRGQEA